MRISYVPVMVVTDTSLRQQFLVNEGNSAGVIYERLRGVYGDACVGASSVRRWVKYFKDGKVMGTVFWNSEECTLVYFLENGETTINAARCVRTLNKLRHVFREKRSKKKTVILQHDNARPHTARLTLQAIQKNS
jgi:hypothetical protein